MLTPKSTDLDTFIGSIFLPLNKKFVLIVTFGKSIPVTMESSRLLESTTDSGYLIGGEFLRLDKLVL